MAAPTATVESPEDANQDIWLRAVSRQFEDFISSIDNEETSGLTFSIDIPTLYHHSESPLVHSSTRALWPVSSESEGTRASASPPEHFSKVWLYANSRLVPHLPPLKVYTSTYPLICLAAQYAEKVYQRPNGKSERATFIHSDFRHRTKPMLLKSLPRDDMNTIVFAIRGSSSIMDWCVNYRTAPSTPEGFLDDTGNWCHSGFLSVAKRTAPLVAERLRALLQDNPGRCQASLLICGHSAGGAVAQLLYAHMMSRESSVQSELKHLTGFFRRVHCVTFGTPPISLLPLDVPKRNCQGEKRSLFFSFINEGDPVVRADKDVVLSLFKLYTSPAPQIPKIGRSTGTFPKPEAPTAVVAAVMSGLKGKGRANSVPVFSTALTSTNSRARDLPPQSVLPMWTIPPGSLSLGGRLILLRCPGQTGRSLADNDDVEAFTVTDDMLRHVVFGDPAQHMMKLYARRVEVLATKAVMGR